MNVDAKEVEAIRKHSKYRESVGELHSDNCIPDIGCYCDRRAIRVLVDALEEAEEALQRGANAATDLAKKNGQLKKHHAWLRAKLDKADRRREELTEYRRQMDIENTHLKARISEMEDNHD